MDGIITIEDDELFLLQIPDHLVSLFKKLYTEKMVYRKGNWYIDVTLVYVDDVNFVITVSAACSGWSTN